METIERTSESPTQHRSRALVVDDHTLIRDGLSTWLRSGASRLIEHVDAVPTLREAREMLSSRRDYAIIIYDLALPDATDLEGLASLREAFPDVPVLVHSGSDDIVTIHGALEKGAQGYVIKNCDEGEFIKCVEDVLAGRMAVPANALLAYGGVTRPPPLSGRETEVLRLLLRGMPNKVIGRHLNMAEGTVKTHLHSIFRQLRVRNRAEAILAAIKLGMK